MKWSPSLPGRTALKYALLQLPSLLLVIVGLTLLDHWLEMPRWVFWMVVGGWVAKDVLLYPLLRDAYDASPGRSSCGLDGRLGEAREELAPSGYVQVGSELWEAELEQGTPPVDRGTAVRVVGHRGLTLLVVPANLPPDIKRDESHEDQTC